MVKVISVKTVRGKVWIELDNGRRYQFRQSDMAGFPLYEGMEIDEASLERRILICQYPDALNAAVAMLARRACSRKEIRDKLLARGWSDETAGMVLTKLDQQNLLDDQDFSNQWTRYRTSGNYGENRIYRELRHKGIDEETARAALDSVSEDDQLRAACRLAEKGAGRRKPDEDIRKTRNRVLQSLLRRGYSWEIARAACDKVFSDADDD